MASSSKRPSLPSRWQREAQKAEGGSWQLCRVKSGGAGDYRPKWLLAKGDGQLGRLAAARTTATSGLLGTQGDSVCTLQSSTK